MIEPGNGGMRRLGPGPPFDDGRRMPESMVQLEAGGRPGTQARPDLEGGKDILRDIGHCPVSFSLSSQRPERLKRGFCWCVAGGSQSGIAGVLWRQMGIETAGGRSRASSVGALRHQNRSPSSKALV